MVLSPFHLLKARITVDANVSVSFITVIIQLSHTASTAIPVPPFPGKAPGRASTPILEATEGIPAEVEDPHLVGGETAAPVE